ncbi:hypothetical protein ACI2LC_37145 [Nonomuraea wenchangensis]|uniref:hypothetical protein n=1 Tax=Nonomuraea wenchangensis TaxID=568860 RepID=UPI0038508998
MVPPTPTRPQGGGRRSDDPGGHHVRGHHRCAWQQLPRAFGASWHPMHRRFTEWSTASMWAKLYRVLLDKLGARGELDWSRCALDSVSARAMKGGS